MKLQEILKKATRRPWRVNTDDADCASATIRSRGTSLKFVSNHIVIESVNNYKIHGETICLLGPEGYVGIDADAALIVRAVNILEPVRKELLTIATARGPLNGLDAKGFQAIASRAIRRMEKD